MNMYFEEKLSFYLKAERLNTGKERIRERDISYSFIHFSNATIARVGPNKSQKTRTYSKSPTVPSTGAQTSYLPGCLLAESLNQKQTRLEGLINVSDNLPYNVILFPKYFVSIVLLTLIMISIKICYN